MTLICSGKKHFVSIVFNQVFLFAGAAARICVH